MGGGEGEGVGGMEGGGRGAGGAPPWPALEAPPGLQGPGGPGVEGGGPGGGGPPGHRHPRGDHDPVEDVDEEEADHIVCPEDETRGEAEHHGDGDHESVHEGEGGPGGDVGGGLVEEEEVAAVLADTGHPVIRADLGQVLPDLHREKPVEELGDEREDQCGEPALGALVADLEPGEQADLAQGGGGEGAPHDLGEGEHEEAHGEEGREDGPVELAEEMDLGPPVHHQPALGEPDEDDAEEETEEEREKLNANCMTVDKLMTAKGKEKRKR